MNLPLLQGCGLDTVAAKVKGGENVIVPLYVNFVLAKN